MRQNTSSPRTNLAFQCFHTCTAPSANNEVSVLFVRGVSPKRISCRLVSYPQHEPVRKEMLYTGSRSGIHRFVSHIELDEGTTLQHYCFKITLFNSEGQIADVVWYSSLGMSREAPLLQHCFAFESSNNHPTWAADTIFYEIYPDRFASSKGYFSVDATRYDADEPIHSDTFEYQDLENIHCGGDLDGVTEMLPYLKDLGFNGIYLTPIFKADSTSKFGVDDYDTVDPHFGGNGALKRLRAKTGEQGMRLLLNAPISHTGDNHPWFDRQERTGKGAMHHKDSPYRNFYTFRSNDQAYYLDNKPTWPLLNYASRETRYFIYEGDNSFIKKYLREPYGIDGWVIDAPAQLGAHGSAHNNVRRLQQICNAVREVKSDALMLGQFIFDARYVLNTDENLNGSINYTGFFSPMRLFFGGINFMGDPVPYTGEDLRRACENYSVGMSQQVKLNLVNQLDNHDMPRFFDIIGGEKSLYLSALACMYAWRGIPCVYQGTELGDAIAKNKLGAHSMIPFKGLKHHSVSRYSADIQDQLKQLSAIRRSNPALTRGSQVFITSGGAYFGFIRLYDIRFSLVLVNASRQAMRLEQGSMLFPLLAAMYLPTDSINPEGTDEADSGENMLIPLSGRNVRRSDHGEGLETLYELLAREKLQVYCFGLTRSSPEFAKDFIAEQTAGKTITMPARSTVIVNNSEDMYTREELEQLAH